MAMRSVLQRVSQATVSVDGDEVGRIGPGLVALVAVIHGDGPTDIEYTASKIRELRIFADADGRMNRSVEDVGGGVLLVSEFTLAGDARTGRRPAFDQAAPPESARSTFDALVARVRASGLVVQTGRFRAHMALALVNDGPVTVLIDSRRTF
jgi:D-tyrosyl-tRNA(Tyr) deacylase